MNSRCRWVALLGLSWLPLAGGADAPLSIAAAANFIYALEALNTEFKRTAPDARVTSTIGASGTLFAQIKNGAPFDVFLSADLDYPRQLVAEKHADASTLRTFATGRLVAWTMRKDLNVANLAAAVRAESVENIALAQPRTAPYGRAAQSALEKLGVHTEENPKLVFGESIAQTAQLVETGNANLGFVALSLVLSPRLAKRGRWHEVPRELYAGISLDHAVVLTLEGAANPTARRYLAFLQGEPARRILRQFGYGVPASTQLPAGREAAAPR